MFRFENSLILYFLFIIPVLISWQFWFIYRTRRRIKKLGETELLLQSMPGLSFTRKWFRFSLRLLALTFLILALANPQMGSKIEIAKRKGIDMMIALDVSNSMLAEDLQPNRLERAKQVIDKIIDRLQGDRIGIVVFAGRAYTFLPITSDYAAAKMFLSGITTRLIDVQGTAIGAAIEQCLKSFPKEEKKRNKIILLISDGENHEDDAIEAASEAAENGIIINALGLGLPEGAPIPVYSPNGNKDYKKDGTGTTIITRVNDAMLQQIAAKGNGIYIRINNTKTGVDRIIEEINKVEKTESESKIFKDYEDRFQIPLALALLFLCLEVFISERRSKFWDKLKLMFNPSNLIQNKK